MAKVDGAEGAARHAELHHYRRPRRTIPLAKAAAKVLGEPERGFFEKAGRFSAQTHADGVYRHLVREGESQSLARRALVLWSTQHDTGAMDMHGVEDGKLRVTLKGFALPSRESCLISSGYLAATFEISGYHDVRVEKQSCCVDGAAQCAWLVSWSSKD